MPEEGRRAAFSANARCPCLNQDDDAGATLADIADRCVKNAVANQSKQLLHAMFKWAKQPGRKFVAVNPFGLVKS